MTTAQDISTFIQTEFPPLNPYPQKDDIYGLIVQFNQTWVALFKRERFQGKFPEPPVHVSRQTLSASVLRNPVGLDNIYLPADNPPLQCIALAIDLCKQPATGDISMLMQGGTYRTGDYQLQRLRNQFLPSAELPYGFNFSIGSLTIRGHNALRRIFKIVAEEKLHRLEEALDSAQILVWQSRAPSFDQKALDTAIKTLSENISKVGQTTSQANVSGSSIVSSQTVVEPKELKKIEKNLKTIQQLTNLGLPPPIASAEFKKALTTLSDSLDKVKKNAWSAHSLKIETQPSLQKIEEAVANLAIEDDQPSRTKISQAIQKVESTSAAAFNSIDASEAKKINQAIEVAFKTMQKLILPTATEWVQAKQNIDDAVKALKEAVDPNAVHASTSSVARVYRERPLKTIHHMQIAWIYIVSSYLKTYRGAFTDIKEFPNHYKYRRKVYKWFYQLLKPQYDVVTNLLKTPNSLDTCKTNIHKARGKIKQLCNNLCNALPKLRNQEFFLAHFTYTPDELIQFIKDNSLEQDSKCAPILKKIEPQNKTIAENQTELRKIYLDLTNMLRQKDSNAFGYSIYSSGDQELAGDAIEITLSDLIKDWKEFLQKMDQLTEIYEYCDKFDSIQTEASRRFADNNSYIKNMHKEFSDKVGALDHYRRDLLDLGPNSPELHDTQIETTIQYLFGLLDIHMWCLKQKKHLVIQNDERVFPLEKSAAIQSPFEKALYPLSCMLLIKWLKTADITPPPPPWIKKISDYVRTHASGNYGHRKRDANLSRKLDASLPHKKACSDKSSKSDLTKALKACKSLGLNISAVQSVESQANDLQTCFDNFVTNQNLADLQTEIQKGQSDFTNFSASIDQLISQASGLYKHGVYFEDRFQEKKQQLLPNLKQLKELGFESNLVASFYKLLNEATSQPKKDLSNIQKTLDQLRTKASSLSCPTIYEKKQQTTLLKQLQEALDTAQPDFLNTLHQEAQTVAQATSITAWDESTIQTVLSGSSIPYQTNRSYLLSALLKTSEHRDLKIALLREIVTADLKEFIQLLTERQNDRTIMQTINNLENLKPELVITQWLNIDNQVIPYVRWRGDSDPDPYNHDNTTHLPIGGP